MGVEILSLLGLSSVFGLISPYLDFDGVQKIDDATVRLELAKLYEDHAKDADRALAVETNQGRFQASAVVLAAGSWSSRIELEGARDQLEGLVADRVPPGVVDLLEVVDVQREQGDRLAGVL